MNLNPPTSTPNSTYDANPESTRISETALLSSSSTPLDACLACPHFKRLCRSTVSGLFGLIGRRPPAA